jgi:hypothetical protein
VNRSSRVVSIALTIVATLASTGCFSQRGNIEAVRAAADKALKVNSFRFEMLEEVVLPNVALPVLYEMKGEYSYPDRVLTEITTHVGPDVKASFVLLRFGRGYFVKLPPETRVFFPGTKEWVAGGVAEIERSRFLGLLPEEVQDISQTISLIGASGDDVSLRDYTALEKKAVNYVSHYVFALDPERLARGNALGKFGLFASGGGEIWVGVDDLLRQMHVVLLGPTKAGGAARVDIKVNLTDHGAELSFRAPRQEEVTSFDTLTANFPGAFD